MRKKKPAPARERSLDPTGASLFAAICARPDDDEVRLVYSDWLEEHGQPERAEAIRLDVRRRSLDPLDPEAAVIGRRLERIAERHHDAWQAEPPEMPGVNVGLEGGLAYHARAMCPNDLIAHQDALFAAGPITSLATFVDELRKDAATRDMADLLSRCKYLDRLRRLDLAGMASPEVYAIDRLAALPGLASLRELKLAEAAHEDDLLESLARCPAWPSLESLNLYRGLFSPAGLRALAGSPLLGSLKELRLGRSNVGDAGLRELLRSPHLAGLRRLWLTENELTSRVMKALADYPWRDLRDLDLSANDPTVAGVRHLANAPTLANLRALDLGIHHDLGDDAAAALARSRHLRALADLDLGSWQLTPRGVAALTRAAWWPGLRRLRLWWFSAGGAGLAALARSAPAALCRLELYACNLTADDLAALLAAPWLGQLTHLNLRDNQLGEAGATLLAEAPALANLVELDVSKNGIPEAAAERLRARFADARLTLKTARD